jgi:hypothetical protein
MSDEIHHKYFATQVAIFWNRPEPAHRQNQYTIVDPTKSLSASKNGEVLKSGPEFLTSQVLDAHYQ